MDLPLVFGNLHVKSSAFVLLALEPDPALVPLDDGFDNGHAQPDAGFLPEAGPAGFGEFIEQGGVVLFGNARQMIQTAIEEKVPFKWVTGDSIYGGDPKLRRWLEEQEIAFVLAVPKNEPLWYEGFKQWPAIEIAGQVEPKDWQRLSAGEGAKGPRLYDWAVVPLRRLQVAEEAYLGHYLLLRRSLEDPTDIA